MDVDKLKCTVCEKLYSSNKFLNKHMKLKHEDIALQQSIIMDQERVKCNVCEKLFKTRKSLCKHQRRIHKMEDPRRKVNCPVDNCNVTVITHQLLLKHLDCIHNLGSLSHKEDYSFDTFKRFLQWKEQLELKTKCPYRIASTQNERGLKRRYYDCSHSGKFYSYSTGIRKPRVRGSCKTGVRCTSRIIVVQHPDGFKVSYYKNHFGHDTEDQKSNEIISNELFGDLLKDFKDECSLSGSMSFGLKKRYLALVKYAIAAEEYSTGLSDAECISQWVQMCSLMEEVPVLLCIQENLGCENEKFVLVIMTEFQKQILKSSSKEVISVDTIGQAHFNIMVLMVIDELETAFPVAYCISNKLTKEVVVEFFICIKEAAGCLSPKYLLTTTMGYMHDAWVEVMGCNTRCIWNKWHIDLVIRRRIETVLKDEYVAYRADCFKIMRAIINCPDIDTCEDKLKKFIYILQNDCGLKKLGTYFHEKFASKCDKWSKAHQIDFDDMSHIHFDIMHFVFISCMTKAKGMFALLKVVMKVLKNKMYDLIIDSFDDVKLFLSNNAITLCHSEGMNIQKEQITSVSDKLWRIDTEDCLSIYVTFELEKCDACTLRCTDCKICVHQYSCSCVDNMINGNLCKHIHAVVYNIVGMQNSSSPSTEISMINSVEVVDDEFVLVTQNSEQLQKSLSSMSKKDRLSPHNSLELALKKTSEIFNTIKSCNLSEETLNNITGYLDELLYAIKNASGQ